MNKNGLLGYAGNSNKNVIIALQVSGMMTSSAETTSDCTSRWTWY